MFHVNSTGTFRFGLLYDIVPSEDFGGHAGGLKVQLFHGATRDMSKLLELQNQLAKQLAKVGVVHICN